jgi:hypothetical protein
MYSAVVLDEKSREKLVKWATEKFSIIKADRWDIVAHYMTIKMGELPSYLKDDMDNTQPLEATGYAYDDKVIAVRVTGYFTANDVPHITIAVNRAGGGKPVMSNKLTNWQPLLKPITLRGTVKEVS